MKKSDYLAAALGAGQIDRREFIGRSLAAGLTMTTAVSLAGRAVRAAGPKKGGTLRIGVSDYASTDTLDPRLVDTRFQQNLNWQVRNNLVEAGPGGKLIPELAESWGASADGLSWTFKLRKGVTFSNGKPLTPADVIYSINLHRGDTKSAAKPYFAAVTEIKPGPDEVTFVTSSANRDFPALLSIQEALIVPEGTTDFDTGIGTGGYIIETFEPGVRSIVKRNPNYWKEGKANFDAVEIVGIKDANARNSALISGAVDAINAVEFKTAERLASNPNIRLNQVQGKAHFGYAMRTDTDPFKSNDARLAFKYGINREEFVQKILRGFGTVGNDQSLNAAYRFFKDDIPQTSYDPDKAKFHAKKAGIDGMTISLHVAETPFAGATDGAVLYSEHLKSAGIDLKVVREPEDGFWNEVWATKPFFATRWSGRVTDDAMLSLAYSKASLETGWNETYFSHDRLDALINMARAEADEDKRRAMYGEAQMIIHDEGGLVAPAFSDFVDGVNEKIGHGELASDWDLDGSRCGERWWFV